MDDLVRNIGDARGYVTAFREHWISQGWKVKSDGADGVSLESPDGYLVAYQSVPDGSRGSIESDTPCVKPDERYPNGGPEDE